MDKPVSFTKIVDLKAGVRNVNVIVIVLEKGNPTKTKGAGYIGHALVADSTASVNLSLWDGQGEDLVPGDIVRLIGGYCGMYKNSLVLYAGRHGKLERCGEFTMLFNESLNMSASAIKWYPDPENPKIMLPVFPS